VEDGTAREIATGDGGGIYLIDNQDRRAVLGGENGELQWQVETAGAVRVVLRCEGYYTTTDGERVARAIVRYHIYRDCPEVRLEHTFVITRENDEVWYREIGISLPLRTEGQARAHFSDTEGKVYTEQLEGAEAAWLFQREYPIYARREHICELGRGDEVKDRIADSAGWAALDGDGAGLMLSVKDFAAQFPKEFHAGNGRLTAKLWSGRDGRILDYHVKTLTADWWREWADTTDTWVSRGNQKNVRPEAAPERFRTGEDSPSCIGVARTHSLTFRYFPGQVDSDRCRELDAGFQSPPLAHADPRWVCHVDSRAFWPMASKGEYGDQFDDIEQFISFWFDQFMVPQSHFPYTGYYDWGRHPEICYFKRGEGDEVRIYADWYRLSFSNIYMLSRGLMMCWARSGDRKYLEAAENFTRYFVDHKFSHWSGGRDDKRQGRLLSGRQHLLPTWKGTGSVVYNIDGDVVGPVALLYLLRDARWAEDALADFRDRVLAEFVISPQTAGGHPNVTLFHLMGLYRVFPSAELKGIITSLFEGYTDPDGPGGMNDEWFRQATAHRTLTYNPTTYKMTLKALATVEYGDLFGYTDRTRRILEQSARLAAIRATHDTRTPRGWDASGGRSYLNSLEELGLIGPRVVSVCYYEDFYGATCAAAFRETGSEELRDVARGQLEAVRSFWKAYHALPPGEQMPEVFERTARNSTPIVGDELPFAFGVHTAGTPFISLPAVMLMLSEFSEPQWE